MAITIGPVTLPMSAEEILDTSDGYGIGAKIWLESSPNGSSGWTAVTSEVIVAGVEAIYFRDPSGTSTTYYRTYLSKSDATQPSDYSATFLVGSVTGYTNLFRAKMALGITDEVDDARLPLIVAGVNAEMIRRTGVFLGPSNDTIRTFDGREAVIGAKRLWIAGGIRTLTAVRIATATGGTLTAATLGDFLLRPKSWELRPGQPYQRIDISDVPVGSTSTYPDGYDNVEFTGTWGPAAVDDSLAQMGDTLSQRIWNDRNAGSEYLAATISKYIYPADAEMLEFFRGEAFPWSS